MSICSGRGTESFFNNLPPAPQRAGGVISISWHTNHPFLSRISEISARPRSTASLLFSLCVASIPKPFPPIFIRARSWAVGAAISSGSFRWLWQTSPERSSPGSPCSGKDRHTPKYAGTASTMRRQSTNGLKTTTLTLKHYATKIQTEGLLYLPRNNRITVSFNTPIADNYSHVYPILIHESNASVLKQLHEAGFSMSMTKKGLEVSKY